MTIEFEGNESKAERNLIKYGVSFDEAGQFLTIRSM